MTLYDNSEADTTHQGNVVDIQTIQESVSFRIDQIKMDAASITVTGKDGEEVVIETLHGREQRRTTRTLFARSGAPSKKEVRTASGKQSRKQFNQKRANDPKLKRNRPRADAHTTPAGGLTEPTRHWIPRNLISSAPWDITEVQFDPYRRP
jgi:hypothetical protein